MSFRNDDIAGHLDSESGSKDERNRSLSQISKGDTNNDRIDRDRSPSEVNLGSAERKTRQ